jgi:hypothetical protein
MVERPMLQHPLHLGRFSFWRLVLASWLTMLLVACGGTIRERTVSDVTLLETSPSALDTDEVLAGLATAAPRTLFWVERERDVYDANLVARDLERIERFYRAHGYYDVKVIAARVESVAPRKVEIEVHVTPGQRVTVRKLQEDPRVLMLEPDAILKYSAVPKLRPGEPFEEQALDNLKTRIQQELQEAGYAYVKVATRATVDLNAHAADVVIDIEPGRRARFGEIRVVGLRQIPERKVRAVLDLQRGDRYSESDQQDAREALGALDLFSRADVTPDLSHPERDEVPIIVTLQEDKLRKLTLGGGTQLDALKLETHVRSGWEHRNFFGGARHFGVNGRLGVIAYPNRLETWDTLWRTPSRGLVQGGVGVSLRQPALFNGRTSGTVSAEYSFSPLLYPVPEGDDPDAQVIVGYHRPTFVLSLQRSYLRQRITLAPSYHLEAKLPFTYQDPQQQAAGLEDIWVSYPRLVAQFTTKPGDIWNDRHRRDLTLSFRNSVEVAGLSIGGKRYLGGSVSDVKVEPELRVTVPLNGSKRTPLQPMNDWILATRIKVGFVLAPDYGDNLRTGAATTPEVAAASLDQQKLLFRAFYSGGSTSNRGYAPQAISPHGIVGFLIPTGLNCTVINDSNREGCTRPLGGFTQWEASAELRYLGLYPLGLVLFADSSDVTRDIGAIELNYPHVSVGPGVRYDTPVGLLRLDLGIRVPGWQAIGQEALPLDGSHGQARPEFAGLPAAIHLALGEAF